MGILYLFCLLLSEFDKNADSTCKRQGVLVISSWFGDLGFAFLVRWLQVGALFCKIFMSAIKSAFEVQNFLV